MIHVAEHEPNNLILACCQKPFNLQGRDCLILSQREIAFALSRRERGG